VTRDIVQPARWLTMALLFVFWAGIYLPGLGNEELKGEEPRRILPGLSMIRSGDWTHPVVAGESYHRKPPLINWLTAGGVLAFGRIDELPVRLPVTLFVLAFALGLAAAVQRVATPSAGFLDGLFVLTNIGMMEK
jgi:4-amino-4-deoxy-L-arabinose transferase-like glycosyltransferase